MFKTLKTFNITNRKIQIELFLIAEKKRYKLIELRSSNFAGKKNTRKNNHNNNYDTIMGVGKYLRIYS